MKSGAPESFGSKLKSVRDAAGYTWEENRPGRRSSTAASNTYGSAQKTKRAYTWALIVGPGYAARPTSFDRNRR
jgi:hypothetical protein